GRAAPGPLVIRKYGRCPPVDRSHANVGDVILRVTPTPGKLLRGRRDMDRSNGSRAAASRMPHELLTHDNCVVALIDCQPRMLFGVANFDRQTVVNNTVGVVKAARAFNVPVVLSAVESAS